MLIGFLPGSIGGSEVVVLFIVILLVVGPRRLPGLAREAGRIISHLRRAAQDFRDQILKMDGPEGSEPKTESEEYVRVRKPRPMPPPSRDTPDDPPGSGGSKP